MITFGTNKTFAPKKVFEKSPPKYGPFKIGDPLHQSYNKTFGHGRTTEEVYVEEREEDNVKYQSNVKKPVWYQTDSQLKTMMNTSITNHFSNVNRERKLSGY
jgi:hypothetical protein